MYQIYVMGCLLLTHPCLLINFYCV